MQSFESGDIVLPPQTPLPVAPPLPAAEPFNPAMTIPYAGLGVKSYKQGKPHREYLWPSIEWWKHALVILVLGAMIGSCFSNSYQSGMTLDNKYIIEEYYKSVFRNAPDPIRDNPISWNQVSLYFKYDYWWPKGISGLYRPLTSLSYWFDYVVLTGKAPKVDQHGNVIKVFNGKPIGDLTWAEYAAVPANLNTASYHTINLIIHWINAILVYLVSLSLLKRLWPAVFIAALFAIHPITTESVTNIIGRADMLAAVAVFGGLLIYMRSRQNTDSWALPWLVGLALITTFGVFSKESAAAVVLVLIVYDIAYSWRSGDERVRGLLPLILHGLAYLGMISFMIGLPALVSMVSSQYHIAAGMPPIAKYLIATVAILAGIGQYAALARGKREIRWASLAGAAVTLILASILVPNIPVVAAAIVVGIELFRGSLTSDNPRFRVVAHAALYLPLFFGILGVPIYTLYWLQSHEMGSHVNPKTNNVDWLVWYLRYPAGFIAMALGLLIHFLTIRADRRTRVVALSIVLLAAITASVNSYWMGILLCLIVGLHEVILGSLTPQTPEYRRDWKLIWHRFAIGYLAMIPAIVAMFAVRAWVFANATPPEEPFLDNPIRGIWKVAELNLPSFAQELAQKPMLGMSYLECKMTAVKVMGRLLVLLAWPQNLCSDYSYSEIPNFSYTFHLPWSGRTEFLIVTLVAMAVVCSVWWFRKFFQKHGITLLSVLVAIAIVLRIIARLQKLPEDNVLVKLAQQSWDDVQGVLSLLALIGIGFIAYKLYNRSRAGFFLIGLFFAASLPTSNFFLTIGSVMAERFMYLPLAGFTGVVVLGFFALSKKIFQTLKVYDEDDFPWHSVVPVVLLSMVLVAYGIRTYKRNPVWKSDRTLWEDAILTSPRAFRCYQSLAFALYEDGMYDNVPQRNVDRMIALDEQGIKLVDGLPLHLNSSRMYLHLGMYYQLKADNLCTNVGNRVVVTPEADIFYRKAVDILERGIKVDRAFNELNQTKQRLRGDPPENISDAGLHPIYGTLAMSYVPLNRIDLALQRIAYGIQIDPMDPDNYARLAYIELKHDVDQSATAMIETLLIDGTRTDIWKLLINLYSSMGNTTAITFDPSGRPHINPADPKMNFHLMQAFRNFIRYLLRAHRFAQADDTRRNALRQYGWPSELFDSLFDSEEIPAVTPYGLDYSNKIEIPPAFLKKK